MLKVVASLATVLTLGLVAVAVPPVSNRLQQVPDKDHNRSNPLRESPKAAASGAGVYREHCEQCHKLDARGDEHHPSLRSDRVRLASDGDLEWFLRQGDLAHGMPSWSALPQAQRWQIVAYLRSIQ